MCANLPAAKQFFRNACVYVETAGLMSEVVWQETTQFDGFSESDLLREYAWVALCSGFKESIVRRVFNHVSLCFCDWESADEIVSAGEVCWSTAAALFANQAKLSGIYAGIRQIHTKGFAAFKRDVLADPIGQLQSLPYIGPITSRHLAKNLGLDIAKPDRHLVRVSQVFGFSDADHLCRELAASTGRQIKVVDLIVWRYLADNPQASPSVRKGSRRLHLSA